MKKHFITAAIIVALLMSTLAACGPSDSNTPDDNKEADKPASEVTPADDGKTTEDNKDTDDDKDTDEAVTIGKIIAFKEGSVTVLTGDIAEDFAVDDQKAKAFYLGETVSVKESGSDTYVLERFKDAEPQMRFTTEGYRIVTVNGTLKEVDVTKIVVTTDDGDLEFDTYDPVEMEKGTAVAVDYTEYEPDADEKVFLDIRDLGFKLTLTIERTERADNGMLVLSTKDADGMEYEVYVLGETELNVPRTDLKAGGEITVYPDVIRESNPAQVDAKWIEK